MPHDCAGLWFVYKAHPPAHIGIRLGGCNAVDGPQDKQEVELFFAGALITLKVYSHILQPTNPEATQKLEKLIIGYNLVTNEETGETVSDLTV